MWIKCKEGIRILIVYFWHSEGWSVRNEALMSNWMNAFDANMEPNDFAERRLGQGGNGQSQSAAGRGSATYSANGTVG